ncbi:MAG: hypothetical protein M0Z45_05455 [Actinomycetota bacterium]|nr:hypothetical protein [Actinomycetota bacterium]
MASHIAITNFVVTRIDNTSVYPGLLKGYVELILKNFTEIARFIQRFFIKLSYRGSLKVVLAAQVGVVDLRVSFFNGPGVPKNHFPTLTSCASS